MKFLTSGKVKDIYELEDGKLLFKFSNRVSAYDVKFKDEIPRKGEVLCKFAKFWFNNLTDQYGDEYVPNHFVKITSNTEMIVKKMNMLPIECVVRGYFYGSLVSRWINYGWSHRVFGREIGKLPPLASQLPKPIFDPTTKLSQHDVPVTKAQAVTQQLVTSNEFDLLREKSIKIYQTMAAIVSKSGFILADLKLEFGKLNDKIVEQPILIKTKAELQNSSCSSCKSKDVIVTDQDIVDYLDLLAAKTGTKLEVISGVAEYGSMLGSLGKIGAILRYNPNYSN